MAIALLADFFLPLSHHGTENSHIPRHQIVILSTPMHSPSGVKWERVVLPLTSFYHGLLILTYLFKSFPTWIAYRDVHRIVLYLLNSYRAILKSVTFPTRSLSAPEVVPGSWVGFGMMAILGTCCMWPALHPFSGMAFLHLSLTGYMSRRWTRGLNMKTMAWCL